ncbi:hypothetical protein [Salinibacterium sp. TMP30]|uniref:hypothetical protein n=1 Tax=Salinibacterium sp. TMP30 TaxID=3138237 RepID=UPI003138CD10
MVTTSATGQTIGLTQDQMDELVDELGLTTVPPFNEGKTVIRLGGRRSLTGQPRAPFPR